MWPSNWRCFFNSHFILYGTACVYWTGLLLQSRLFSDLGEWSGVERAVGGPLHLRNFFIVIYYFLLDFGVLRGAVQQLLHDSGSWSSASPNLNLRCEPTKRSALKPMTFTVVRIDPVLPNFGKIGQTLLDLAAQWSPKFEPGWCTRVSLKWHILGFPLPPPPPPSSVSCLLGGLSRQVSFNPFRGKYLYGFLGSDFGLHWLFLQALKRLVELSKWCM